jgi:hypothetical protein
VFGLSKPLFVCLEEKSFTTLSPDCYERDLQHELLGLPVRKRLKQDAVPTLNLIPGQYFCMVLG